MPQDRLKDITYEYLDETKTGQDLTDNVTPLAGLATNKDKVTALKSANENLKSLSLNQIATDDRSNESTDHYNEVNQIDDDNEALLKYYNVHEQDQNQQITKGRTNFFKSENGDYIIHKNIVRQTLTSKDITDLQYKIKCEKERDAQRYGKVQYKFVPFKKREDVIQPYDYLDEINVNIREDQNGKLQITDNAQKILQEVFRRRKNGFQTHSEIIESRKEIKILGKQTWLIHRNKLYNLEYDEEEVQDYLFEIYENRFKECYQSIEQPPKLLFPQFDETIYNSGQQLLFNEKLKSGFQDVLYQNKTGDNLQQKENKNVKDFFIENILLSSEWNYNHKIRCQFKIVVYQLPSMVKLSEHSLLYPYCGFDYKQAILKLQGDDVQVWFNNHIFSCKLLSKNIQDLNGVFIKINQNRKDLGKLLQVSRLQETVFFIFQHGIASYNQDGSKFTSYLTPQAREKRQNSSADDVVVSANTIYALSKNQVISIQLPSLETARIFINFQNIPHSITLKNLRYKKVNETNMQYPQCDIKSFGNYMIDFSQVATLRDLKYRIEKNRNHGCQLNQSEDIEILCDEQDRACIKVKNDLDHEFYVFDKGIQIKLRKKNAKAAENSSQKENQSNPKAGTAGQIQNQNQPKDIETQRVAPEDNKDIDINSGLIQQQQQQEQEKKLLEEQMKEEEELQRYKHTFDRYEFLEQGVFLFCNNTFFILIADLKNYKLFNIKLGQEQKFTNASIRQIDYKSFLKSSLSIQDPMDSRFRQRKATENKYRYAFKCLGYLLLLSYKIDKKDIMLQAIIKKLPIVQDQRISCLERNQSEENQDQQEEIEYHKLFEGDHTQFLKVKDLNNKFKRKNGELGIFFTNDNSDLALLVQDNLQDFFIISIYSEDQLFFEYKEIDKRKIDYILYFNKDVLVTFHYKQLSITKYYLKYTSTVLELTDSITVDLKQKFRYYFKDEQDYQFFEHKKAYDNFPIFKGCYVMRTKTGFIFFDEYDLSFKGFVSLLHSEIQSQSISKSQLDEEEEQNENQLIKKKYATFEDDDIIIWDANYKKNVTFKFNDLNEFLINPNNLDSIFPLEINFDTMQLKITGFKRKAISCFNVEYQDSFIELLKKKNESKEFAEALEIADQGMFSMFFQKNKNLLDIFYNLDQKDFKKLMDKIVEFQIDGFNPFIFIKDKDQDCFLKLALKENLQKTNIQIYVDTSSEQFDNPFYSSHIEFYLLQLMEKNYNVQSFLQSNAAYYQCESKESIDQTMDPYYIQAKEGSLKEVIDSLDSKIQEKKSQRKSINSDIQEPFLTYIVNIPTTLSSKGFIPTLAKHENESIFETQLIQSILDHKWQDHCKFIFRWQFLFFCIFITAFLIDIYFIVIFKDERNYIQVMTVKIIGYIYICYMIWYESISIIQSKWEYFYDIYNYNDMLLIITYTLILIFDLENIDEKGLQILYSMALVFCFFKSINLLRQFKGFNFLISMLLSVFQDLKYFIILYGMVLAIYGIIFTILEIQPSTDEHPYYYGINLAGYLVMSFRASIGDFQIDNFNLLDDELIIFTWIVWISAVMILNVILLNFIIAVISSSYEKVLQTKVQQQYKHITWLILERETHYGHVETCPNFLIVRTPARIEAQKAEEWEGHMKSLKREMTQLNSQMKSKSNQDGDFLLLKQALEEIKTIQREKQDEVMQKIEARIETLSQSFQAQFNKLNKDLISREANKLLQTQKIENVKNILNINQPLASDNQDDLERE